MSGLILDPTQPIHGSAFSFHGAGCLIVGPSGTGKSSLVAEATQRGAKLIGDDRIVLQSMMGMLSVAPVPELAGILELRGLGLVRINDTTTKHVLHLIVELDEAADARLPELEHRTFLDQKVPYLRVAPVPKTSITALLIYLKAMQEGRVLPTDWKPQGK